MAKYNHSEIEKKWQQVWAESKIYETDLNSDKPKHYNLVMFPYPSGAYLHMGHGYSYSGADVYGRFKKLQGFNVFEPIGYDSFGLPAENYAIKQHVHPALSTKANIEHADKQLESFGAMFDFSRKLATSDPSYYKWTQWLFLQLYKQKLAYQKEAPVNWCPKCLTVLANEQVIDEHCERCETEVIQKSMKQWFFKITDYADRLVADLDKVDWPESSVVKQRNWIGRSEGATVEFRVSNSEFRIKVFTTRIDTLFGATFMVLAPEHPFVARLLKVKSNNEKDKKTLAGVEKYVKETRKKSDLERQQEKKKTGVFTGEYAINPINNEKIPIWVSDYVLMNYGTGAIMAVPAHDERDYEFAKKFNLLIREVIVPYTKYNPQEGKPTEERELAVAVVRNPKDDTYLCLDWKTTKWKSFPAGGIDGEDYVTAAKREVLEETGYKNLKLVKEYQNTLMEEFYRPHKDSNVIARYKYLVFELGTGERAKVDEKESKQHEAVWIKRDEVAEFINIEHLKIFWNNYLSGIDDDLFSDYGRLVDSAEFTGLSSQEAMEVIVAKLQREGVAKKAVSYKLKDWSFSRQRFWGAPIPIVYCSKCGTVPIPEKDLPVLLPEVDISKVKPMGTGKSPLANIPEFVNTKCPKCGGAAERETDTMDTFVCSSFYYLRYPNVGDDTQMMNAKITKKWLPVDMYVGGAEHVTMHLLYSRFVTKALYDTKLLTFDEPFMSLRHQGMILGPDGKKMSKSKGNVVIPDEIIREYGADIFRTYILFMGPFEDGGPWNPRGIVGVRRFMEKVYDLGSRKTWPDNSGIEIEVKLNKLNKKVEQDVESFKFNTAIAAYMEFINVLAEHKNEISRVDFEKFLILLNPFAPHLTEELWSQLGNTDSVCLAAWPEFDSKLTRDELTSIAVQVNGKVRDTLLVPLGTKENEVLDLAMESEKVAKYLKGAKIKKSFYVEGKILSIVVD